MCLLYNERKLSSEAVSADSTVHQATLSACLAFLFTSQLSSVCRTDGGPDRWELTGKLNVFCVEERRDKDDMYREREMMKGWPRWRPEFFSFFPRKNHLDVLECIYFVHLIINYYFIFEKE